MKTSSYADAHEYREFRNTILCGRRVIASDDKRIDGRVILDARCPSCQDERRAMQRKETK